MQAHQLGLLLGMIHLQVAEVLLVLLHPGEGLVHFQAQQDGYPGEHEEVEDVQPTSYQPLQVPLAP